MTAPELLAPAGSLEGLRAACDHGADAVYVGVGPHNLRARGANFSIEEFKDCIAYCKKSKRRIYAALNSMPGDKALDEIEQLLRACSRLKAKPDAFIISDPGVLTLCRRFFKTTPLHLSTQTGTFNGVSAQFWKPHGVSRVILPREFSLEQIRDVIVRARIETEVFVHGAMCVSVSGRCLLGAYLGKRHPNWGDCPQPCRLRYRIAPQEKDLDCGEWLSVEEEFGGRDDEHRAYILNSKDLNTLSILPRIIATGVSSLKIEGRNKSAHYVGSVVKIYRAALDACINDRDRYSVLPEWTDELNRLDHRPYTTGFYGGDEYVLQETGFSQTFSSLRIVGTVKAVTMAGEAVVDVKNPFGFNDVFNVLPVRRGRMPFDARCASLTDMDHNPLNRALTNRVVLLTTNEQLSVGDMLRKEDATRESRKDAVKRSLDESK
jgi:putative protease